MSQKTGESFVRSFVGWLGLAGWLVEFVWQMFADTQTKLGIERIGRVETKPSELKLVSMLSLDSLNWVEC